MCVIEAPALIVKDARLLHTVESEHPKEERQSIESMQGSVPDLNTALCGSVSPIVNTEADEYRSMRPVPSLVMFQAVSSS